MNLKLSIEKLCSILDLNFNFDGPDLELNEVVYDTRNMHFGKDKIFFALQGKYRNGLSFIQEAYDKGIRVFIVGEMPNKRNEDAHYLLVSKPLDTLLKLAKWHRDRFHIPIVVIAGTHGKTTTKEWLGLLLKEKHLLVKSPKSYNSRLGVALSILELHSKAEIGLFEVSISQANEGGLFKELLSPDYGIICHNGAKYNSNFVAPDNKEAEYLELFQDCKVLFQLEHKVLQSFQGKVHIEKINATEYKEQLEGLGFEDIFKNENALLALGVARYFGVHESSTLSFSDLAMRLETYDGIYNSLVINDTYSLDKESLAAALQYQSTIAKSMKRVLLLPSDITLPKHEIDTLLERYAPITCNFVDDLNMDESSLHNAVILVKGNAGSFMNKVAHRLKLKHHRTRINVNLSALRRNVHALKELLPKQTKSLVMVKANAYGTGMKRTAVFIEELGIDYLGVAYTDEGVRLRNYGVKCPILVMSPSSDDFHDCIEYNLEPAIFSLKLLDDFVGTLILKKRFGFPIHLKIDTGMNRLGLKPSEISNFMDILHSQPELRLKGVYSHFAESDNELDSTFTEHQFGVFIDACNLLSAHISYPFIKHIANSAAIITQPKAALDMVRMGLIVFGVSQNLKSEKELDPVIEWLSEVTQIKQLKKGDSVGYNREFIAENETDIAIIPVGYADGFRRSLGGGKGTVFIGGKSCKTVGNICMDMAMVDVTGLKLQEGDTVEIIGENQSIRDFSNQLDTIPYEVLTALSLRVHRNYILT